MVKSILPKNKVDLITMLPSGGQTWLFLVTLLRSPTSNLHAISWACLVAVRGEGDLKSDTLEFKRLAT